METSKAELLDDAIAAVNRLILLAQDCGLPDSAQFLAMAKTQLLIDRNGITDGEFRALCDLLDGRQAPARDATPARQRPARDAPRLAMPAGRARRARPQARSGDEPDLSG